MFRKRLEKRIEKEKRRRRRKIIIIVLGIAIIVGGVAGYDYYDSQKNLKMVRKMWQAFEKEHPVGYYDYEAYGELNRVDFVVDVEDFSKLSEVDQEEYLEELDKKVKAIDECKVEYKFYSDGTRYWLKNGDVHSGE